MSDRDTRKNLIIGATAASAVVGAIAVSFLWRNRNARHQNNESNLYTDGMTDSSNNGARAGVKRGTLEAAESYITALSRLLEEAGIVDDREEGEKFTHFIQSENAHSHACNSSIRNSNRSSHERNEDCEGNWLHRRQNTKNERFHDQLRVPRDGVVEVLRDLKEDLLTNDGIAKVVLHLIKLKNAIDPNEKVDIRNIHFINDGKQEYMVIEMCTSTYGAPAYDTELSRLWREVFPVQDFWNEGFSKVRVNVKETGTDNAIETVSCSLDDIKLYLCEGLSEEQFVSRCKHKRAKNRNNKVS